MFSPLVERAMRRAARAHRTQLRKSSDVPYLTHLASVALILQLGGFHDEHVLAAALLHDCVEDAELTLDDLRAEFPPAVVEYVAAATERKYEADGRKRSWEDRKAEHIEQVAAAPLPARAIILADKLHNIGTMLYDLAAGESLWERFGAAPSRLVWYYTAIIEAAGQEDAELKSMKQACLDQLHDLSEHVRSEEPL